MDIYNNKKKTSDELYNNYNNLLFSGDKRILSKMFKRIEFFLMVKDLPGDIFEVGVFKGAGVALWLSLKHIYSPHSIFKIVGFDIFNSEKLLNVLKDNEKEKMNDVLKRSSDEELTKEAILEKLGNIRNNDDVILIEGDCSITTNEFVKCNPGCKIKILYLDVDLKEPTYNTLINLWDNIMIGGIIVFDEYNYHCWNESQALDDFLKFKNLKLKVIDTGVMSPSAYIIKS